MRQFNEAWYQEIRNHSKRDQLSFNYVAYKLGIKPAYLSGSISNNPHFERLPHQAFRLSGTRQPLRLRRKTQVIKNDISMVFLYYDNPIMLMKQIECWDSYADYFTNPPIVRLIDDGSPRTFAADIVRQCECRIPIHVYRIQQDIPWNFSGARNLGCLQSSGWIYISDIDTLLLPRDAQKLFDCPLPDHDKFYMPKRVWLPDLTSASPGIVNLLFHKKKYLEIGGYDEDYVGYYGREETDFHNRLSRSAQKTYRKNVLIRVMPPTLIPDACTTTPWPRDKNRNTELYERKLAAGFVNPTNPLRFTWEMVI